jgi:hypothetical protein
MTTTTLQQIHLKNPINRLGMVVQDYNPSNSGGGGKAGRIKV